MSLLLSTWVSYFAAFYLACLGCGLLYRRGFVPLHLSALVGTSAYVFAAFCGKGIDPILASVIGILVTMGIAVASGLVFIRVRAAAAALITISMQFLFDRYVNTAEWTGGSAGLWQGIPNLEAAHKITISLLAVLICGALYVVFQRTVASRLLVAHGHSPLLTVLTTPVSPSAPLIVVNLLVGFCAGCAGLALTLQTQFIAPSSFSLNWGLLYAGTILLVGWRNLGAVAIGALVFSLLPELLRFAGLGQSDMSAWRGVFVGIIAALVVWAQFPRMVPTEKQITSAGVLIRGHGPDDESVENRAA